MPEQVPDGIEHVKDGTARVFIDGEMWKLRRPKTGEFRKFRESLQNAQDELLRYTQAMIVETNAEDTGEPEPSELEERVNLTIRTRERERSATRLSEDLSIAWMREVFEVLADKTLGLADDDLPVWLWGTPAVTELLGHWRDQPLARGVG